MGKGHSLFIEEARWINGVLRELQPQPAWIVLDVGSSTEYFRRVSQPYIDYYVFLPLRRAGAQVLHIDAKRDEGIDVVWDIAADDPQDEPARIPVADVVICSNLLEHVIDRNVVAKRLSRLTKLNGHLIVTVPHVYRYHEDPIDTMYRPTDDQLVSMFLEYGFQASVSVTLDVACGYVTVPTTLLPLMQFQLRRIIKRVLLNRVLESDRCQVTAVVLRKQTN
jgi:SAM-dependent methyltransferase